MQDHTCTLVKNFLYVSFFLWNAGRKRTENSNRSNSSYLVDMARAGLWFSILPWPLWTVTVGYLIICKAKSTNFRSIVSANSNCMVNARSYCAKSFGKLRGFIALFVDELMRKLSLLNKERSASQSLSMTEFRKTSQNSSRNEWCILWLLILLSVFAPCHCVHPKTTIRSPYNVCIHVK